MDRRRFVLAAVALAAGLLVAGVMLTNDVRPATATDVVVVLALGWSFVATGLVAWQVRPGNAIGPVMVVTGFLQLGTGLGWSQNPVLFVTSHVVHLAIFASVVFILLAFPSGRLQTTLNRAIFGAALVIVGPLNVAWLVVGGGAQHGSSCVGCPQIGLQLTESQDAQAAILWTQEFGGAIVAAAAVTILVLRWRHASVRLRYAIAPVLWVGAAALAFLVLWLVYQVSVVGSRRVDPLGDVPWLLINLIVAAVAIAFLAGVARPRLARSAVADLVVEMGGDATPAALRESLAMHCTTRACPSRTAWRTRAGMLMRADSRSICQITTRRGP